MGALGIHGTPLRLGTERFSLARGVSPGKDSVKGASGANRDEYDAGEDEEDADQGSSCESLAKKQNGVDQLFDRRAGNFPRDSRRSLLFLGIGHALLYRIPKALSIECRISTTYNVFFTVGRPRPYKSTGIQLRRSGCS